MLGLYNLFTIIVHTDFSPVHRTDSLYYKAYRWLNAKGDQVKKQELREIVFECSTLL
jgi:hypothetical protein